MLKLVFRQHPVGFEEAVTALSHARQSSELEVDPAPARGAAAAGTCPGASLASFLHRAAALGVALQIRVCNFGAWMQACSPVRRVKRSERAPWINVLDPELELHLYEERIRGLRLEQQSQDCGWLHWLADDGACAFSVRAGREFAALAAAAQ